MIKQIPCRVIGSVPLSYPDGEFRRQSGSVDKPAEDYRNDNVVKGHESINNSKLQGLRIEKHFKEPDAAGRMLDFYL